MLKHFHFLIQLIKAIVRIIAYLLVFLPNNIYRLMVSLKTRKNSIKQSKQI